ncbi:MAG: AAA domain-containing protein [Acidimicrobiia bacterium]
MTEERPSADATPLHPIVTELAEALARDAGSKVEIVRGDAANWLAIEETASTITFVEAEGNELHVVPFVGDAESIASRTFVQSIGPSWLDGEQELVVDASALATYSDRGQIMDMMHAALDYWTRSKENPKHDPLPEPVHAEPAGVSEGPDVDFSEPAVEAPIEEPLDEDTVVAAEAHLRADISDQWSWASSAARIPQISDLTVEVAEPIEHARISVLVRDADVQFGSKVAFEGALQAGTSVLGSVHVPLSSRVMSQVEERHPADCVITLEDGTTGRVLARYDEELDVQPRDLWFWAGDPRRSEQRVRIRQRGEELAALLQENPERPDAAALEAELETLARFLQRDEGSSAVLSRSLLASFVRPNHPDIATVAREAADLLGRATGDSSFFAFQIDDVARAEERADATVTAIYEALQARSISYSEPPPGWDYRGEGQRIRDHSDVAKAGLGTCMDTTVLTAAVIEQAGLLPVLVFIPGHIFVGYWRRDPLPERGPKPEWYPNIPVVFDPAAIHTLIEGGWLGVIETTAFTAGKNVSASDARSHARYSNIAQGLQDGFIALVDVAAARRAGVSPLPAINERADGITEIIEYRSGGAPAVTEVATESLDVGLQERQVDNHPARYRTWKSSLFSLNATNALLNLGMNARVQPIALPPEGLGILEDKLHQDVSFSLHSGFDIPEVWRARDIANAMQLMDSSTPDDRQELLGQLNDRKLFVQRFGRVKGQIGPLGPSTFFKEMRSMAHNAKSAYEERGMNPLFLCLGLLRWPYKPGVFAEAPLILVPVSISVARGRQEFTLSLDSSQQTTPNAALIEWLRREHGLSIPGLAEPLADRAGIDVDGVLAEVRQAIAERGLPLAVAAEARLATLDLSAFRMWQDLNINADHFFERPLVSHLVNTPTETFVDPAIDASESNGIDKTVEDELEKLEAPIPADSTQKRAVLWARQGRTFVLQGPPGTGKSQTITNMVAECLVSGLRVLFVAEKGTALSVVQRRLESIGLGPFTLNLHHEGSNAAEVRAQLKRSLTATVNPDGLAMENARRQLRNARFELTEYPQKLHKHNAAGLSAYGAHDELLVLGDGPTMPIPSTLVAHEAEQVDALKDLFEDLQRWTSAAAVREDHPWRLAGAGKGDPFDVDAVSIAVRGILQGMEWSETRTGQLREALDTITHPNQLDTLAAASNPVFPTGEELAGLLDPSWPARAADTVSGCERAVAGWSSKLHGFAPDVLSLDIRGMKAQFDAATSSGFMGRKGRQTAALAALAAAAPTGLVVDPSTAGPILADLVAAKEAGEQVQTSLAATPGLGGTVPQNPYMPGALSSARARLDELTAATASLRDGGEWTRRVNDLARGGELAGSADGLSSYAHAWRTLWDELTVQDADFQAWRQDLSLADAVRRHESTWRKEADYERLVPLQRWCTLVRKLEPMRTAGLGEARIELLEGRLPAYTAEDALARGVAKASLSERISAEGLDRFDAVAHDQRVTSYSSAQEQVRTQWVTDGPARMLAKRGGGGLGSKTGGLARELEKTTRKLGTRPILRKYGEAVQELTPLVLCSPSSVVDLIEPGVMEFDLVIFDEASQITVPEAIGALGRARAAVVVGDSKQMPPTRKVGGGSVDDEELDDDVEEIVEDQESILSECELARVPTLSLSWHYRSQDEALIAFSNRAYYRGDLSSFPTPTLLSSETGVEFRRVSRPDGDDRGMYLRAGSGRVELGNGVVAGSNTNPFEAVEIVKYVHELVHASNALPSVGIVTFNEQQRQLIEDMLNASADSKIAEVMDPGKMGRGDVLFVKALEQVQGDERDIIVFSVAFSKQASGKIPTNFGPLTNSGGERRLNVAVTRARRKNVVFCSFEPAELDVAGAAYQGPKDLKEFLVFARAAGSLGEQGETAQRIAIRDRHRDEIAAALRAAGLHVMSDVGLSNFRLDLVLSRPENPERPLLPVLLDGESWQQRSTVSDRDVLPVEVLENLMGWPKVARIWWPMWLQNREEVVSQILREVDDAEAGLAGEPAPPLEPFDAAPESVQAAEPAPSIPSDPQPVQPAPDIAADVSPAVGSLPGESPFGIAAADSLTTTSAAEAHEEQEPSVASFAAAQAPVQPAPGGHAAHSDGDAITPFAPAHTNVVGSKDVLDQLPERAAASVVREQVIDVIETEGPIEVTRLARIVARRFGLNAVRAARADDIIRLVPRAQVRKSRKLGSFAWPSALDPDTWAGFRIVDENGSRTLDEIAPQEIANAMLAVLHEYSDIEIVDDLLRRTAEIFGFSKLGAKVRDRLEAVYQTLPTDDESHGADDSARPLAEIPSESDRADRPTSTSAGDVAGSPGPEPAPPHVAAPSTPPSTPPASTLPEPTPMPVSDPVIDQIAAEADDYTPDLSRVNDYSYYDYVAQAPLRTELKRLVNEIVLDPTYDGSPGNKGVGARAAHLSIDDAHAVGNAASMIWSETVGNALSGAAERIAAHLATDPAFDPLPWEEDINTFVASRLVGKRPGLVSLTQRQLNYYAQEKGLIAKVEAEIQAAARRAFSSMTPLERDAYGFTSRNAKRLQLAEPYLDGVKENRRRFVVYWMSRFEAEELGLKREARYATASRRLAAQGQSRAAISRILGISTSIMDRIERENRADIPLPPDDPIFSLAPTLR